MKLLIITAVAAYEKDIISILKKSNVKAFSHQEVKGYRDTTQEAVGSNWFAGDTNEYESLLFYAFVNNGSVDEVFSSVEDFNNKQETLSKVHLAVVDIERNN